MKEWIAILIPAAIVMATGIAGYATLQARVDRLEATWRSDGEKAIIQINELENRVIRLEEHEKCLEN